ncbi:MAG TPA: MBL fold metallo-hydrolase [Gammaproteobacteria bacterium]|nr:MBL fold metallo-hydrolase [Gammaproteobacteria bacterium]
MRFALLGSGSRGNATLIQSGRTCVMVDCGFSATETTARLARLKIAPEDISAILITHEHSDHVNGVARFASRYDIPIRCTSGTLAGCAKYALEAVETFDPQLEFELGDLGVKPLTVPHDAREPTQFILTDGRHRLGILTDTGSITDHIRLSLSGCDALILECNHDGELLENGPYPEQLKARIGGPLGHLSNAQAAGLLEVLDCGGLQHLVAAHLSEKNNSPQLACEALAQALHCELDWIEHATQETGLGWRDILTGG